MNSLSQYWKAIIAVVGTVATALLTVGADPDVASSLPSGWAAGVLAAGTVVTGVVAVLKRNSVQIDQIQAGVDAGEITLHDLRNLYDRNKHGDTPPLAG